ncbi:MAG: hypothetical protein A3C84_02390 [Candidatus Ryanbacteria bacterium RIFCSPHIGHO2_02_FULL_48_12]|uniref:Uncharacterized protein n=1 Tax=Candidatus Ryanbacteria bacterium RIFCSPHIGHO2_01_FULL_48_27 TaxID=1802115 RepID=A0A1G2G629_9BACT|nr:MAG: hypothetical protein A2756_01990 [Candidatus Ryanbacteria bacterium RIFCSPHIGHO2_01_FULL_48_27]OGZ50157.1 MAG: hypothetical protein A3C84_02390 [Candidatus Ryanbacteria bacterium RIFCSPHIGHO2_02_FULL_48_12]
MRKIYMLNQGTNAIRQGITAFEVQLAQEIIWDTNLQVVFHAAEKREPMVVCVSYYFNDEYTGPQLASVIRRKNPDAIVVAYSPSENCMRNGHFSCAIPWPRPEVQPVVVAAPPAKGRKKIVSAGVDLAKQNIHTLFVSFMMAARDACSLAELEHHFGGQVFFPPQQTEDRLSA